MSDSSLSPSNLSRSGTPPVHSPQSRSTSSSSSDSFSEDCDDSVVDKNYLPGSNDELSDSDNEISQKAHPSTTRYIPLLDNPELQKPENAIPCAQFCRDIDIFNEESEPNTTKQTQLNSTNTAEIVILTSPSKKGRKRKKNPHNWKSAVIKQKRNRGEEYEMRNRNKTIRAARQIKSPCAESCKFSCFTNFSEDERKRLFSIYWELGDIELQRQFLVNCMKTIEPQYRYIRIGGTRAQRQKKYCLLLQKF